MITEKELELLADGLHPRYVRPDGEWEICEVIEELVQIVEGYRTLYGSPPNYQNERKFTIRKDFEMAMKMIADAEAVKKDVESLDFGEQIIYSLQKNEYIRERFTTTRERGRAIEGPSKVKIVKHPSGVQIYVEDLD